MSANSDTPSTDTHSFAFAIYLLVILIMPWPLGSNRDWAWPIMTILCCLLALTFLLSRKDFHYENTARVGIAGFMALCAWMLFQLVGIPGIIEPITSDSYSTRTELLRTIGYGCFFFVSVRLLSSQKRIEMVLYVVVLLGMLEALSGSVQQLLFELARARGSFPNPNHYAGFLEITLAISIGLILAQQGDRKVSSNPVIEFITGPRGRLRLIIIIMVIGLVMSRSRMGNIGFLTSILISSGIAFYYSKKVSRGTIALIASILIIDVIIIGSYFGLERLGERFEQTSGAITGRVELHAYHAEILQDHIWVGSGAGTYEMTMPRYRDRHIHSKPTHAENDYIELLIELGFIGTLPMLLILINGIQAQISLLRLNDYHFERGIAFGCLTGTVAILIHGFGDVNLQIPANALLFVLMLALPAAIQQHRRY